METVITKTEGENLTHRVLWQCCVRQLDVARAEARGRMYFDLAAMLMAYLAYEAYLNFVGTRVAAADWEDERAFFARSPYRGNEGKLQRILESCRLPAIDKGVRPYQTVVRLAALRDLIAHAKPERYAHETEHSANIEPTMFGPDRLKGMVSADLAERAVADVEKFCEAVHQAVRPTVVDQWFGNTALTGVFGYSTHSSTATPSRG